MIRGEKFELECLDYLRNTYSSANVNFHHNGGMNSTVSDISVIKNGKLDFFIEVKDSSAQSGQFVVHPDYNSRTFIFSPKNHSLPNIMTDIIINYMNTSFERFCNAGTAGASIDIDSSIFASWIIKHYIERNVKYIISHSPYGYVIFPIRKFAEYFGITATYRIKKSGSTTPAARDYESIAQAVSNIYRTASFYNDGKKLFVTINEPVSLVKFPLYSNVFYLSGKEENLFEIRKLSNTRNMNVIFSIHLKKSQDISDLAEFTTDLL